MERDFDVIVIGSGAGGGAFAQACAAAGKSVLVLERGGRAAPEKSHDEYSTLIAKGPYDDRKITVNGVPTRLFMGGVVGGSTALFGAALMRPSPDDFHPGRWYGERLDRELWDWPISYSDLEPYYAQAESLYCLAAALDDYGPLPPPTCRDERSLIPLAPINRHLIVASRSVGLKPFRLPLAIDATRCFRCDSCAGYLCPNGARRTTASLIDEFKTNSFLMVRTNCEVEQLTRGIGGTIEGVVIRDRLTTRRIVLRGNAYALAAGAIGSAALLLKSGFTAPHIGRNYMMHYSPVAVGLFPRPTGAYETFIKQLGFADYYFGTPDYPHKMGIVQSLPAPGPLMLRKLGLKLPFPILQFLRKRMLPLVGIIEDLPNPCNRVLLQSDGSIGLQHEFSRFDLDRGRSLGRAMHRILKQAGAWSCASRSVPSKEHVAHQCGTLRFGKTAEQAVVDSDCRMFGHSNLFVVDGSFLPTSLGVGPALTITANALRVAEIVIAGL